MFHRMNGVLGIYYLCINATTLPGRTVHSADRRQLAIFINDPLVVTAFLRAKVDGAFHALSEGADAQSDKDNEYNGNRHPNEQDPSAPLPLMFLSPLFLAAYSLLGHEPDSSNDMQSALQMQFQNLEDRTISQTAFAMQHLLPQSTYSSTFAESSTE
jgi:hypothetical protein